MFYHHEQKILPYNAQFMYDLVCDVDAYPQFLPWCVGARVTKDTPTHIIADLVIGYKALKERFTSDIRLNRDEGLITIIYLEGPFKNMTSQWKITEYDNDPTQCHIDFEVSLEFNNRLLSAVLKGFFDYTVQRMITAFEERAHAMASAKYIADEPH